MARKKLNPKTAEDSTSGGLTPLPVGWIWSTVGEVGEIQVGRQRSPKYKSGQYPTKYVRAANVTWDGLDLSDILEMDFEPNERAIYSLRVGDIVLTEASGSADQVGKAALWRGEIEPCCFQNTVIRFRPISIDANYALLVFRQMAKTGIFVAASHGVGIAHLSAKRFSILPFPLPPLAEQRRIAAEVQSYREELEQIRGKLQRVQMNLNRYCETLLEFACSGRLVPNEFQLAQEAGYDFESGGQLLERILRTRHVYQTTGQREKEERVNPVTVAEDHIPPSIEHSLSPPSGPFALPGGWTWTTLATIAGLKGGITKGGRHRPGESIRSVPYLRVANVQRGYLDLNEIKSIDATEREIAELRLESGDILFNEGGDRDKLGRGWIWRGEIRECIHQNHVFRARLFIKELEPRFYSWYGNSFGRNYFMQEGKQTTNLASINLTKLGAMPIPLPPLSEQRRIVAEVDLRLTVIKEIGSSISSNLERVEQLGVIVLRRAVVGQLSRRDPADEPAGLLLKSIQEIRVRSDSERANLRRQEMPSVPGRKTRQSITGEKRRPKLPLGEVLAQAGGSLTPQVLFERAGYDVNEPLDVESFYAALRSGIQAEAIVEVRPNEEDVLLKVAI